MLISPIYSFFILAYHNYAIVIILFSRNQHYVRTCLCSLTPISTKYMNRKVIFLDIDGTLTEPGSNVPPASALQAIKRAQEKGHYVFLCTGRNYDMLSPLLQYGFDGVVGSSGGYVVCQGEVIFDCPMTEEQRVKAMDILVRNDVYRTVECLDGSYTDDSFKEFLERHADEGGNSELLRWRRQIESQLNIQSMSAYRGQPVYKLVVMCERMEQLEEPKKLLGDEFQFVIQEMGGFNFLNGEILNKKFDKGTGVRMVCEHLGIPVEDSIGYGDSMNDIEMIETTGLSICMANGAESLKRISDEVCPAVTEDGLYHSFVQHALI